MKYLGELCQVSGKRWRRTGEPSLNGDVRCAWDLRHALLDFIADFANWDASNVPEFLGAARAITAAAHLSTGGVSGTRPLVVDPFAGGGAIPLEAARIGADTFASDLNPIPVLLNKVTLEYVPRYGRRLADAVRAAGERIKNAAELEVGRFYPKENRCETPVAWLWARTIHCEGPGCGVELPLIRSCWLAQRGGRSVRLRLLPDPRRKYIGFEITDGSKSISGDGTASGGSATCPLCGYTTSNPKLRAQLAVRHGGARSSRLFAVAVTNAGEVGRRYRLPTSRDLAAVKDAEEELQRLQADGAHSLNVIPDELIPTERPSPNARGLSAVTRMGVTTFGDLFATRPALTLSTLARLVSSEATTTRDTADPGFQDAVALCLALAVDRLADSLSSLATWASNGELIRSTFARQALSIA